MPHSLAIFRSLLKCLLAESFLITLFKPETILLPASLPHSPDLVFSHATHIHFTSFLVCLHPPQQKRKSHEGKRTLFCLVLSMPRKGLAHSGYAISIFWINKQLLLHLKWQSEFTKENNPNNQRQQLDSMQLISLIFLKQINSNNNSKNFSRCS